jgi:transcriptional regulator with XRE-family HTH domain
MSAEQMSKTPKGPTAEELGAAVGQRVRELMKARGLTGKDMAAALGLSTSGISDLLHGRSVKQYVQLAEIARLLGVTPNDLLGFDASSPPDHDIVELIGATVEALLMEQGWPEDRAVRLVRLATEAAQERQILDTDRKLAARAIAISRLRHDL